jgi:hypothetical protein
MDYGGAISFVADKFHFLMLMKNYKKVHTGENSCT